MTLVGLPLITRRRIVKMCFTLHGLASIQNVHRASRTPLWIVDTLYTGKVHISVMEFLWELQAAFNVLPSTASAADCVSQIALNTD